MIYFITPQYLKDNTLVGENVDTQNIDYLIKISADTFIRSYLGTYFYNDLLVKYNSQSLSPDEITLVGDYIKPSVAQRAAAESIIGTTYQLKNKGIQQQSGDFSSTPENKTISWLYEKTRDKAEFYDQLLIDYLVQNQTLYPVFGNASNTDSKIKNGCGNNNAFQSGITFI